MGALGGELFTASGGERVVARAAMGVGFAPFGFDPALQEQALERGIEGTFFDGEDVVGESFDGKRDSVSVERSAREGF